VSSIHKIFVLLSRSILRPYRARRHGGPVPWAEWREVKADSGWFIAPKEGEKFRQGLTSPIVLVLVLDFDRHWLGERKAASTATKHRRESHLPDDQENR
jgi:hypothetical protein